MRIKEVKPSQRREGRLLVKLEDGSILRLGEETAAAFGLRAGMDLGEERLAEIASAARAADLRAQAAGMAGRRALSRRELEQKLQRRGAEEEEIRAAADWLEDLGAIDDAAYARLVARHYGDRGYGPGRVREELRRRGVPRAFWDDALAELPDSGEAIRAFLEKKAPAGLADPRERKRLADALLRRGFSWEEIRPALDALGRNEEDWQP